MSAEMLREAAALMRARATAVEAAAVPTPWRAMPTIDPDNNGWVIANGVVDADYDNTVAACEHDYKGGTAAHIASWHPSVALAVADWLEGEASRYERDHDRHEDNLLTMWRNVNETPPSLQFTEHVSVASIEYADGRCGSALAVARAYLDHRTATP